MAGAVLLGSVCLARGAKLTLTALNSAAAEVWTGSAVLPPPPAHRSLEFRLGAGLC